jgi:hypothetical protein
MNAHELSGIIIGGIAVAGGLAIGAIAIIISVPWSTKEKLTRMEIRSRERLAMLEKGIDPEIVFKQQKGAGQDPMLWGLLLAGMGLGIVVGLILSTSVGWDRGVLTNAMGILGSGLGLIIYSIFRKRPDDKTPA